MRYINSLNRIHSADYRRQQVHKPCTHGENHTCQGVYMSTITLPDCSKNAMDILEVAANVFQWVEFAALYGIWISGHYIHLFVRQCRCLYALLVDCQIMSLLEGGLPN